MCRRLTPPGSERISKFPLFGSFFLSLLFIILTTPYKRPRAPVRGEDLVSGLAPVNPLHLSKRGGILLPLSFSSSAFVITS